MAGVRLRPGASRAEYEARSNGHGAMEAERRCTRRRKCVQGK